MSRRTFLYTSGLLVGTALAIDGEALAAPALQSQDPKARRRALLIGVNKYRRPGLPEVWLDLHCDEDVRAMRRVLLDRFGPDPKKSLPGFTPDDVLVVADGVAPSEFGGKGVVNDTSRASILRAFDEHLLKDARPGDVLFFHYSGHGGITYSETGEPLASLVPSDWGGEDGDGNHITQADLTERVQRLKDRMVETAGGEKRVKGTLFMVFDCCHSGDIVSGVRGEGELAVRGRNPRYPLKPPANAKPVPRDASRGPAQGVPAVEGLKERGFVALLACRYHQLASEHKFERTEGTSAGKKAVKAVHMGRLTYVLEKAMREASGATSYRDLFGQVRQRFAVEFQDQTPEVEGTPDYVVFTNGAKTPEPSVPVTVEPPEVYLEAGSLLAVTEGSVYDLYPAGTKEFAKAKPLAQATVRAALPTRSLLSFKDAPTPAQLKSLQAAHAVEVAHAFPASFLTVDASVLKTLGPNGEKTLEHLVKRIGKNSLFEVMTGPAAKGAKVALARRQEVPVANTLGPTRNAPDPKDFLVPLLASQDFVLKGIPEAGSPEAQADLIYETLKEIARREFLASLLYNESSETELRAKNGAVDKDGLAVQLRMVPVTVKDGRVVGEPPTDENVPDKPVWKAGETFSLQIRNVGVTDAYVTIFDLTPTGQASPLWPQSRVDVNIQRTFKPLKKWVTLTRKNLPDWYRITPPYGEEQIKVIATRDEFDFGDFIPATRGTTRDVATRALQHPLGPMLRDAQDGLKRAEPQAISNEEPWGTATVTFTVAKST